ncbi:MAG: GNAT family N-acetyltransferase [Bacteroidaceae bacterium]|nr:GNAT family N-acetyltransferase [Bacteroidaceae bacterium]
MSINDFRVIVADSSHVGFSQEICDEIHESAKKRGTGIAKRSIEYISSKMIEGKAIIAFASDGTWAGFTYIESWEGKKYVANSGLIVNPLFRNLGLAKVIKRKAFALSLKTFKGAKMFGLTTGLAVMKINSDLGYHPVTFSELTSDNKFWEGCKNCINYPILLQKERRNCLCTAMLFDPSKDKMRFDADEALMNDNYLMCEQINK